MTNLSRNTASLLEAMQRAAQPILDADLAASSSSRLTPRPRLTKRVRRGLAALGRTVAASKDVQAARAYLAALGLE